MGSTPIRIIVVDDNTQLRLHLIRLLNGQPDITVVAEAGDGLEALDRVAEVETDILLLDVEMPHMSGLEVTRRLSAMRSPVKILVLSAYNDHQFIEGARSYGASGYLLKEDAIHSLAESVRRVARGEQVFADGA